MESEKDAILRQQEYYARTASDYDNVHAQEMKRGLEAITGLLKMHKCNSVLDVGSGTGNVVLHLLAEGMEVRGVEPSKELLETGVKKGIPEGHIVNGSGEALPFPDKSFDAVCELGVLHHVKEPELVVAEMIRTARHMVILCDANRFGQGSLPMRVLKLLIYKLGLWKLVDWIRTGGKGYMESEGDGLFYSYSTYDSLHQLARWADSIIVLPSTEQHNKGSWFQPLLTSPGVLIAAIKE